MAKLLEHFRFDDHTRILDVGGSGDWDWEEFGIKAAVTVINLYPPSETGIPNYVQGDACDMLMFKDREFDLVFSNAPDSLELAATRVAWKAAEPDADPKGGPAELTLTGRCYGSTPASVLTATVVNAHATY